MPTASATAATSAPKVSPTRKRRRAGSWKCVASGEAARTAERKPTSPMSSASASSPPRSSRTCSPAYVPWVWRISRKGQKTRVPLSGSVTSSPVRVMWTVARRRAAVRPSRYAASQSSRTSGEAEVHVEEACEAFAGRAHLLRLLRDGVERQRPLEGEPREAAAHPAHREPRPRETDGEEEAHPRRDRQPGELRRRHRRAEARAGDARVLGVVALALRGEPEPRESQRRQEQHDRPQPHPH